MQIHLSPFLGVSLLSIDQILRLFFQFNSKEKSSVITRDSVKSIQWKKQGWNDWSTDIVREKWLQAKFSAFHKKRYDVIDDIFFSLFSSPPQNFVSLCIFVSAEERVGRKWERESVCQRVCMCVCVFDVVLSNKSEIKGVTVRDTRRTNAVHRDEAEDHLWWKALSSSSRKSIWIEQSKFDFFVVYHDHRESFYSAAFPLTNLPSLSLEPSKWERVKWSLEHWIDSDQF